MIYFTMTRGLRGCYMPDDCYIVETKDIDTFKKWVKSECEVMDMEASDEETLEFAFHHIQHGDWKEVCVATDESGGYGIMVSGADENDYLAQELSED
jgi:hypothetical protein